MAPKTQEADAQPDGVKGNEFASLAAADTTREVAALVHKGLEGGMEGKSDDEVLAFLDGDADSPPDTPPPNRVEKAPESPSGEPESEKAEKPEVEAKAPEKPAEEPPQADETGFTLEQALAALRRYGAPDGAIEKLEPKDVIAWGRKVAKIQADTDQAYTDLKALKTEGSPPKSGEPAHTDAVATAPEDRGEETKRLAEALALDEDQARQVLDYFDKRLAPLREELTKLAEANTGTRNVALSMLFEDARRGLKDRFPQLGDDQRWKETVVPKVQALMKSGEYDNLNSAVRDASLILFHDELQAAKSSEADEPKANPTKDKARVSPPSARTPPPSMSHDDRLEAILYKIEAGATDEEAAAAGGW